MKYQTIHIEGAILSADILDKIERNTIAGQKPADFGTSNNVKDDIAAAWADAQSYWAIYQRRIEQLNINQTGVTETRNLWMVPLLGLLGYSLEVQQKGEIVNGKNYPISHRDKRGTGSGSGLLKAQERSDEHVKSTRLTPNDVPDKDPANLGFPVHIMGCNDELDRKRTDRGPRMSPHGLLQEYLNLTEHLYGIVSNGLRLRLLRDSSRLVKLSYIEFDLERMMRENHYADFAIMYRLIHASRMPADIHSSAESLIELFHQESLDSGSRIRDGLSEAVEKCIKDFANGFLSHPDNESLRETIREGRLSAEEFYHCQLRLIYRLLFLMVIEERDLIFPKNAERENRDIYYKYYSINRLRNLAGKRYLADEKHKDYWISIKNTFRLFENEKYGAPLGILPLAGDLFGWHAIGELKVCSLDNSIVIECLTDLSIFTNPVNNQKMRVNYAALNVEEFGSVYEGLLEYDPHIYDRGNHMEFTLEAGQERSASGSHYTPDELVQPLIKHSLEYIIEDKLKEAAAGPAESKDDLRKRREEKLLSITVCDVACGSGHILLNAARGIATELALVRTGEEQPSPQAFRAAIRDVIRNCIYGVDLNPLAVELCKVALWLEAHNPNEPLNFLDHHIKCGNAIVGLAHKEELENGIPNEAFKKLPGDDKDIAAILAKRNKQEAKERISGYRTFNFEESRGNNLRTALRKFNQVTSMPENTPEEIEAKAAAYKKLQNDLDIRELRIIADIQVAQFFIPKTEENLQKLITDEQYFRFLNGELSLQGQAVAQAMAVAGRKRVFHWFLEFPQVMANGGFDCILGNPPYLGGTKISGAYGGRMLKLIQSIYKPAAGRCDLAGYFLRRIYSLQKMTFSFQALITTNTIAEGDTREGGLDWIIKNGAKIIFANKSISWPGQAAVKVSLISIMKGIRKINRFYLNGKNVTNITPYLTNEIPLGNPYTLLMNTEIAYSGSCLMGDGFLLNGELAKRIINSDMKYSNVIKKYINGTILNSDPEQRTNRRVIDFSSMTLSEAEKYPECLNILKDTVKIERSMKASDVATAPWWLFWRSRNELYSKIKKLNRVLVHTRVSKTHGFIFINPNHVMTDALCIFAINDNLRFSLLQSALHENWSWKHSSALKSDRRYSVSDAFETFPFPQNLSPEMEEKLEGIGEEYHEFRRQLMLDIQLGLTKTYNKFHNCELRKLDEPFESKGKMISVDGDNILIDGKKGKNKELEKYIGKETYNLWKHIQKINSDKNNLRPSAQSADTLSFNEAVDKIRKLRRLHKQMDEAVLAAYGWHRASSAINPSSPLEELDETWPAIDLAHDFYEVDYLPENNRVRYTISPEARKEVLKRLLLLNHRIYAQEVAAGLHNKKKSANTPKKKTIKKAPENDNQGSFDF